MKIQCSCGAKYAYDVTPANAATLVKFICPACGVDSSEAVNEMIQRELAASRAPAGVSASPAAGGLKLHREASSVAAPPQIESAPAAMCAKHGEPAAEACAVCRKPVCPKCMELFGYFCSPFCKSKAEANSLKVPEYAGQFGKADARFWRKTGLLMKAGALLLVLLVGVAIWYNFYAALPHAIFSVHFDQRAAAGQSLHAGEDQLVFLHGGTLARYDIGTKKELWSHELIEQRDVDEVVAALSEGETRDSWRMGSDQKERLAREQLEEGLSLLGSGKNLWLKSPGKLTHYDWDTGNVLQVVSLDGEPGELVAGDDELLMLREAPLGQKLITHVNYVNGSQQTEAFQATGKMTVVPRNDETGGSGLPSANGDPNRPLDPNKVADQAQHLTTPARIALAALVANNLHQQAIMKEIQDDDGTAPKPKPTVKEIPAQTFTLVPSPYGYVQYTVKLLEERVTTREAMKAPPAQHVMNGDLTAGQGTAAVNEMLNEQQRANGGDKVTEDDSRYQITVRRPDDSSAPDWSGEVVGPPVVYPQKTVNVVAAGKGIIVLDKENKKLWEASLLYNVSSSHGGLLGDGPCVEHGDTLYVMDQAVLTAFDLSTGNARWRLPSVGVAGLFFDDEGNVYVNTTTANVDKIKFSRQIDVEEAIDPVVLKVDGKTGKNLWTAKTGGMVAYVSGPFVYTFQAHDQPVDDMANDLTSGLQLKSFMKIIRLNPKNGRSIWEHDDIGAPVSVSFDKNEIYLVFHTEVEVLKYLAF